MRNANTSSLVGEVPFVAAYVSDVNLPERRITVDWGLDY